MSLLKVIAKGKLADVQKMVETGIPPVNINEADATVCFTHVQSCNILYRQYVVLHIYGSLTHIRGYAFLQFLSAVNTCRMYVQEKCRVVFDSILDRITYCLHLWLCGHCKVLA